MPRGRPRKNSQDLLLKSADMLGWALGGLEREIAQTRERLAALTAQAGKLRARLGVASGRTSSVRASAGDAPAAAAAPGRKRRKMSAEARKRISDMMKKRWAERRKRKE
jgi:hypothetical protein